MLHKQAPGALATGDRCEESGKPYGTDRHPMAVLLRAHDGSARPRGDGEGMFESLLAEFDTLLSESRHASSG